MRAREAFAVVAWFVMMLAGIALNASAWVLLCITALIVIVWGGSRDHY